MTREIKFRVWDATKQKMYQPEAWNYLRLFDDGSGCIKSTEGYSLVSFNQNHNKLMQYTGLNDKNGKEIYEGDIVRVDNSSLEENGEYDVNTVCRWDKGCFILEDEAGGHWTRQLFHYPERLTIVGNIYENQKEPV